MELLLFVALLWVFLTWISEALEIDNKDDDNDYPR